MSFESNLSDTERNAKSMEEWSDKTIVGAVRELAKIMTDESGRCGIAGLAAIMVLNQIMKETASSRFSLEIAGTAITVRLRLVEQSRKRAKE